MILVFQLLSGSNKLYWNNVVCFARHEKEQEILYDTKGHPQGGNLFKHNALVCKISGAIV